ncbi:MAG: AAA family ATPase [Salinisphaera sp.]|nr:AAA family ATPase [Salinisphaera sp.]
MNRDFQDAPGDPVQVLAVTSSGGGLGKTGAAINLAAALANRGQRVMLLDGADDAALTAALDLRPPLDLGHVLRGEAALDEVLIACALGLTVVPNSRDGDCLTGLTAAQGAELVAAFSGLSHPPEVLVVDTATGGRGTSRCLLEAAGDVLVVIGNDPGGLISASQCIARLHRSCRQPRIRVCANRVADYTQGQALFERLDRRCEPLGVALHFVGVIPDDPAMAGARAARVPVVNHQPGSPSARAFKRLARRTESWAPPARYQGGVAFFAERLIRSDHLLQRQAHGVTS